MPDFILLILLLILNIISIIRWKLHPFLALILTALVFGLVSGLDVDTLLKTLTEGFGNTLGSIGIVIALGTVIGTFLEKSGGTRALANFVLKLVGEKKAPLAMNITGFIVSIPVFCDSGFVILAALNKALSKKSGIPLAVLAISLATGLYATHVFVPPTPGPLAAAATIGADIGIIILLGLVVAVPTALAGLLWGMYFCRNFHTEAEPETVNQVSGLPGTFSSFAPLVIPIILIALRSVANYPGSPLGTGFIMHLLLFAGHPVVALLCGVFLSFRLIPHRSLQVSLEWVGTGLKNAGVIILITGAGGALGNVLRSSGIGVFMGEMTAGWNLGIVLPFIIAAILKSAQGSSTVAIITTAALMSPLLSQLGLDGNFAKALVVLSIGAGSMTVSHVNDSYFWVVSQFSGMNTSVALRCLTLASLWQGITGLLTILILAWWLI